MSLCQPFQKAGQLLGRCHVTVGTEAGQIVLKQARYVVPLLACVADGTVNPTHVRVQFPAVSSSQSGKLHSDASWQHFFRVVDVRWSVVDHFVRREVADGVDHC